MFGKNENNEENNEKTQEKAENSSNKYKIDEKTAEMEFDNFCEMWDIDNNISVMNDEDKSGFNKNKSAIVKAFRQGRLIIDREKKTLVYTISDFSEEKRGETLVIRRLKGADFMAMDNYKEKDLIHKTYSVVASMVGRPTSYISSLDNNDLKVLQACMILFSQG